VLPAGPLGGSSVYAEPVEPPVLMGPRRLPVDDRVRAVADGVEGPFFRDAHADGLHVRIYTIALDPGAAVQLARPLDEVDRTLGRLRWLLLLVGLGGAGAAGGIGLVVTRAGLAPVSRLTEAAEHVTSTHDLSRRIDTVGNDELGRLAGSFNTMLGELEGSLTLQRQLVADASHELRTPLTSLRTNAELLETEDGLAPEERRRIAGSVMTQVDELTGLVDDLVELARGDEPSAPPEQVRLDVLVADAVERARRYAPHVRIALETEPVVVRGVPDRLDRAIGNLLDNAAKWSPPGGVVEVEVGGREVAIRDHGPGIAEDDLPHIFDRFYRAPAARGLPGSGLGLAIVRQVAQAHGGSIVAESASGGGARFRLKL